MVDSVQCLGNAGEIGPENLNRFMIEVDGCEALEARPLAAEAEATAAAKEIKKSRGVVHGELKVEKSFN